VTFEGTPEEMLNLLVTWVDNNEEYDDVGIAIYGAYSS
jgi:hypothetical protein